MTTIESDDRGLRLACPECGQRNRSIPAFALFKSGREVARQTGAMLASAIRQFVEQGAGPE